MKQASNTLAAALLLTSCVLPAAQAEPYAPASLLGQNCAACHGTDGREFNEAMPPLAGMDKAEFVRAMREFRGGERQAIVMDRIAKAFSDAEIEAMADYFAEQPAIEYGEAAQ